MSSQPLDKAVCPYCGSPLIYDEETMSYICPKCGYVFGYETIASFSHLSHVTPASEYKPPDEALAVAASLLSKEVANEIGLSSSTSKSAQEITMALYSVVTEDTRKIPMSVMKKALEVARRAGLNLAMEMERIREKRVKEEITEKIIEYGLDLDPDEVFDIALLYKHLWAGRRSSTIAWVFLYLVGKKKGIKVPIPPRILKIAKLFSRVVRI